MGQAYTENIDWGDALDDFQRSLRVANKEEKTQLYYKHQLSLLRIWAQEKGITIQSFRPRHLREYLDMRLTNGVSDRTRRHDVNCARMFFRYCRAELYIESDPLRDYILPAAPRANIRVPSQSDLNVLMRSMEDRWAMSSNPRCRFVRPALRRFYLHRNIAIVTGLIDTSCRVGELLNLKMHEYNKDEKLIFIAETKTDTPREVPINDQWIHFLDHWLSVRPKIDSPYIFITVYGDKIDVAAWGRIFKGYTKFAKLEHFSVNSLRHYSINDLAETDLWAASQKAGHKRLETTRIYLHGNLNHVRRASDAAGTLGKVMINKRSEKEKRKRIV